MARAASEQTKEPVITLLRIELEFPGCRSLKEKRGRLQSILNRLHKVFNLSAAEIGHLDVWQSASIACAIVSNDKLHNQQLMENVIHYLEQNFPDEIVLEHYTESR